MHKAAWPAMIFTTIVTVFLVSALNPNSKLRRGLRTRNQPAEEVRQVELQPPRTVLWRCDCGASSGDQEADVRGPAITLVCSGCRRVVIVELE
jgi:hypothetical protein